MNLTITREPRENVYRDLVKAIGAMASTMSLVVRQDLGLSASASRLLQTLEGIAISDASEWPGTRLHHETAQLWEFPVTPDNLDLIAQTANGLYEWAQPSLPEDLAFYRSAGDVLLGTISHERDAFLNVEQHERDQICVSVPGLECTEAP